MHVSVMLPMLQVPNSFFPFNPSLEDEMKRLFDNFAVDSRTEIVPNVEDIMEEFRHNGRDFEYCPDLDTDVTKQIAPRRKKNKKPLPTECVFCRNNGEEETYYRQHLLKDMDGRVRCPVLRAYTCPICGACGDEAHTVKYCPKGPYNPASISTANAFKLLKNSMGKRRGNLPTGGNKHPLSMHPYQLLAEATPYVHPNGNQSNIRSEIQFIARMQ